MKMRDSETGKIFYEDPNEVKQIKEDIDQSLEHIGELMPEVEKKNLGLTKKILDMLEWE